MENNEEIVSAYVSSDPTPETNAEILKELGEQFGISPNKVRVILTKEGVYVKKDPIEAAASSGGTSTKRGSKEAALNELRALLEEMDKPIDEDIISKLTGKAANYIISILK